MPQQDADLAELERLLDHTTEPYRALRHGEELQRPQSQARPVSRRRRTVVASGLLAASIAAALFFSLSTIGPAPAHSRFSMPAPVSVPVSLRPQAPRALPLSVVRSRLPGGMSVPVPPKATRG